MTPYVSGVRPLRALTIYLVLIFLGGALLAPWVYWGVHALAERFPSTMQSIATQPFHRYVNRCIQGIAVLGLIPLLRALGARSWNAVGVVSFRGQSRNLLFGFGLGLASLAIVAGLSIAMGARHLNTALTLGQFASLVAQAAGSAVMVAALEELLFRGVLFGRLRPVTGDLTALLVSSLLYSFTHYFQRPTNPPSVHWNTGFKILGQMTAGFQEWQSLIPGFVTLALAGIVLAWLFRSTGALYAAFGLHAGWVFWMKLFAGVTREPPEVMTWVWGSSKLVDGWTALGVMVLCAAAVSKWSPQRAR